MTTARIILTAIICIIVFIGSAKFFSTVLDVPNNEDDKIDKMIGYLFIGFASVLITAGILAIVSISIYGLCRTTDNYHTIYSNKMNAKVVFKSYMDNATFVGGQPIKKTTNDNRGTLTLSKDGVDLKKNILSTEYTGDVEEGSIVEKIEYSKSTQETKLFGVSLFKDEDYLSLKIHLKKTAEKVVKEKKDAKIEKELNSILSSSN